MIRGDCRGLIIEGDYYLPYIDCQWKRLCWRFAFYRLRCHAC